MQYSALNCRTVFQICKTLLLGFPGDSHGKESACNAGNLVQEDPWVGKNPWRRKWQPKHSCLGNLMEKGAWWAIVHSIAKSHTRLKSLSTHTLLTLVTML